jgi:hypothetical protein
LKGITIFSPFVTSGDDGDGDGDGDERDGEHPSACCKAVACCLRSIACCVMLSVCYLHMHLLGVRKQLKYYKPLHHCYGLAVLYLHLI